MFIDDDAFGVTTISESTNVLVRRVKGEDHVRAELFKTGFAMRACAVRVDHAADGNEISRLGLRNSRADFGNTADNLMSRNNRIIRGHELAPLVADRMKVGVSDAAVQDCDLHVALRRIASRDNG